MKSVSALICMLCMFFAPIFGCWYTYGLYTESDGNALIQEVKEYFDDADAKYGERTKTDDVLNRNLIAIAIDIVSTSPKYDAAPEKEKQRLLDAVEDEVVARGYIADEDIGITTSAFSFEDATGAMCVGKVNPPKLY